MLDFKIRRKGNAFFSDTREMAVSRFRDLIIINVAGRLVSNIDDMVILATFPLFSAFMLCKICYFRKITVLLRKFLKTHIIMKKLFPLFLVGLMMSFLLGSCGSSKNVAYFQNADSITYEASKVLYDAKIMPKDQLTITVITTDPEASRPFNLSVSSTLGTSGQISSSYGSLQPYLVDNQGNIEFPVIGSLHVAGLTKTECETMIKEKLSPYLSESENPVITVSMASYRVTIIGEVSSPGVVSVPTEKMSVLEALAQRGDLTIYGRRENVMLIREDATGQKHVYRLNLNDANLINSPYYYLQQNDIIYVEPNSVKTQNSAIGSATTLWISFASTLISIASLVVNILK